MTAVDDALATYLEVVDAHAPGVVEGVYVVGSYALGDWHDGTSDIDIVAVTADPADEDTAEQLRAAHEELARIQPTPHVDGPYVAWGDLSVPSMAVSRPWVLANHFHHDAECFELNPCTWYTLATYGISIRGPAVSRLGVALDRGERIRFALDNLDGYWRAVHGELVGALGEQPADGHLPAGVAVWCLLGAARLHHTVVTGDVTSKLGAADHGLAIGPREHHRAFTRCRELRAGGEVGEVDLDDMARVAAAMAWVLDDAPRAARR